VIYFKKFEKDAHKPAGLDYILFGSSREQFLAHLITAKPDFDQVLSIEADNDQMKSAVENAHYVMLEIPGTPNSKPVSDTKPLARLLCRRRASSR
jgi:hypothetical protein